MSNIYSLEPPTEGKVLLRTTAGDVEIELWAREAPKAVRNFVQLCMEGYYDGVIFHRVIPGFMVQGGDPTGTGEGGASVYGAPFRDELHSRLRFTRRGLVACANLNEPDTNGSQFFFTLDKCPWLDRKHTIFGKVAGDTIYNVAAMGEVEIGEGDRPVHPPKITGAEVLWNPFPDIKPRIDMAQVREEDERREREEKEAVVRELKQKARRRGVNTALVSFGDEMDDDGAAPAPKARPVRPRGSEAREAPAAEPVRSEDAGDGEAREMTYDEKLRASIRAKLAKAGGAADAAAEDAGAREAAPAVPVEERGRAEGGGSRRAGDVDELLNTSQRARKEFLRRKKSKGAGREKDTLARLSRFTSRLHGSGAGAERAGAAAADAPADVQRLDMPAPWRVDDYLNEDEDGDGDVDVAALRQHKLAFVKTKGDMDARNDPESLEVFDPLEGMRGKFERGGKKRTFSAREQGEKKRRTEWGRSGHKAL
ncbi:unnamed protein product [Pedinophyceae sp. YPF-701]|nr:unnamed protein product [Pedinophyceae sp. YPF-701]